MTSTDDPELTIYEDLEQGSSDWLQARCGIPTSTTISAMLTPTGKVADNQTSRTAVNNLAAERLTNRPPEPVWSRDIERGHLDEPLAREVYEQWKGVDVTEVGFMTRNIEGYVLGFRREVYEQWKGVDVTEVGFMIRNIEGYVLGFIPDGLVADDGLVEIKSRKPQLQLQYVLTGYIPFAHFIQMQTGMLVSGRDWCDYCSYSGGLPMHIKRVYADFSSHRRIIAALVALEERAEEVQTDFDTLTALMPPTEYVDHFEEVNLQL